MFKNIMFKNIMPLSNKGKVIHYEIKKDYTVFFTWGKTKFILTREMINTIVNGFFSSSMNWYKLGSTTNSSTTDGLGQFIADINVGLTHRHASAIAAMLVEEDILIFKAGKSFMLKKQVEAKFDWNQWINLARKLVTI